MRQVNTKLGPDTLCLSTYCVIISMLGFKCNRPEYLNEYCTGKKFKAAPMNIFSLTMNEITVCNMKVVSHSDKPAVNFLHFAVTLSYETF